MVVVVQVVVVVLNRLNFKSTNIEFQVVFEQLGCQRHALEVGIQQLYNTIQNHPN